MGVLSESDKRQSAMRAAFFIVVIPIGTILLSLAIVIIASIFNERAVDYQGMALLSGALAAPASGMAASKAYQKRYESRELPEEN